MLGVTAVCLNIVAELKTGFCFFFFLRSVIHVFPRFRQFPYCLSEFSLAPCDSFLVSDWTL